MAEINLLSSKNQCGKTLLRLTSRGNAIIAELLRLSENIPRVFFMSSREDQEQYKHIVLDFSYFKTIEYFDEKIDSTPALQDLDESFKEGHFELLERFYKAFDSVYRYVTDLQKFLQDLDDGVFIYQTLENVLANNNGKQLMTEALYLFGVMLLVIENQIPGPVRERLIVSYQRYCGSESAQENIEDVIQLLRSTGFVRGEKRPDEYPESLFARAKMPREYVTMVISRLRSDDIFSQMTRYPHPDHRSTALSSQAAMLFVILFFDPRTLKREQAKMREIVDKHFPDNWVISYYMGMTVNLCEAWEPYKAARLALNNTLDAENVVDQAQRHIKKVPKLNDTLLGLLKEGVLSADYLLDNVSKLLKVMREANVTLQWLILHTYDDPTLAQNKRVKQVMEQVVQQGYDAKALFQLLLNVSQFEFTLNEMFATLLDEKESRWNALKKEGSERMSELSDVFGGNMPLSRVQKDENLQKYFKTMSERIASFDYADSTATGRKIVQMKQALEELLEHHQVQNSLNVRQFLRETQSQLAQMIRTINIEEKTVRTISVVSDISYAWNVIDSYTGLMQQAIKANPKLVIKLRATFLKLASALELPLVRINQASSPDLISVSQFYSSRLVSYIKRVLQIIPQSMFELLNRIQQTKVKEVPTRLEKLQLKDYAQIEERQKVAALTYHISVFTAGILSMKSTLVGVVQLDPKELLEGGLRQELVRKVAYTMDAVLVFNNPKTSELILRLNKLSGLLENTRKSIEYIQDYVAIYGLKIWQEEVSRIVNFNVEMECNSFLGTVASEFESQYQDKDIEIPVFPPKDAQSLTFVGRLAREFLACTSPEHCYYVEKTRTWYDTRSKAETMTPDAFKILQNAIGTYGLNGLDRLFSFMVVKDLKKVALMLRRGGDSTKTAQSEIARFMKGPQMAKDFSDAAARIGKLWAQHSLLIIRVGHYQLMRRMIGTELNFAAKFDATLLLGAVSALNTAFLTEIEAHYQDPSKPYPGEQSDVLSELRDYLTALGCVDPMAEIYITTKKADNVAALLFFTALAQLHHLSFSEETGTLISKKSGEPLDGPPFVCGLITVLKQYHSSHTGEFLAMAGKYVQAFVTSAEGKEAETPNPHVVTMLNFIDSFAYYAQIPRKTLHVYFSEYLLDEYRTHTPEASSSATNTK